MPHEEFELVSYEVSIRKLSDDVHIVLPLPAWLGDMAAGKTKGGFGAREAIAEFNREVFQATYSADLEVTGATLQVKRAPTS